MGVQVGAESDQPANSEGCRPTVSIVIPCHNYGRYLTEALESALGQTRPADEVIVVDDGSTDETLAIASRYVQHPAVRVIGQPRQGAVAAYNRGVRASSGDFFLILSADDRLDPRYLERTVPLLAAHPEAGYVYTAYRMFGARHRVCAAPPYDAHLLGRRPYIVATALMRRAAFDQAGGFSAAMEGGHEDWEFFVTLAEHGWHGIALPEVLFHYRKHSTTSRNALSFRQWVAVRRRVYAQHRSLYRLPLRAFLALAVLDQQWLRLRAAPRALLRLTGRGGGAIVQGGTEQPRVCLVASGACARRDAHAAMLSGRFRVVAPAARWARYGFLSAASDLFAQPARDRADLYHAYDPASLIVAALAAMRDRAILLYDRPSPGPARVGIGGRVIEWALRWRLDGVTCAERACADPVQRRLGVPPLVLEDAAARPDVERQRLLHLYTDLLGG